MHDIFHILILCYTSISDFQTSSCISHSCDLAENVCLPGGTHPVDVPVVADDIGLIHHNDLFCHLFDALTQSLGMATLVICPAKTNTISGPGLLQSTFSGYQVNPSLADAVRHSRHSRVHPRSHHRLRHHKSDGKCNSVCTSMRIHGSPRAENHDPCRFPRQFATSHYFVL